MKTADAKCTPTAWRDMQRDWDAWSIWEQRVITGLGCVSGAGAFVWFVISLSLV